MDLSDLSDLGGFALVSTATLIELRYAGRQPVSSAFLNAQPRGVLDTEREIIHAEYWTQAYEIMQVEFSDT